MRIDETNSTRIALTFGPKAKEEADGAASPEGGGVDLTGVTSRNMLASNFFDNDYQQSKYATGLLDSLKIENTFGTQLQSLVQQGGLVAPSDVDNYATRILAANKAARKVEDVVEAKVSDKVGDQIGKNTDEMEKAAEKKTSGQKDETAPDREEPAGTVDSPPEDGTDSGGSAEVPAVEAAPEKAGEAQSRNQSEPEVQPQSEAEAQQQSEPEVQQQTETEVQPRTQLGGPAGEYVDMII